MERPVRDCKRSSFVDKNNATRWYVATFNRGLMHCGNRAAYKMKGPVVKNIITYVGIDAHKKEHKVAAIFPEHEEIVEMVIPNRVREISKMIKKLKKRAPGEIHFCYEAGVCGFDLQRRIQAAGSHCAVTRTYFFAFCPMSLGAPKCDKKLTLGWWGKVRNPPSGKLILENGCWDNIL